MLTRLLSRILHCTAAFVLATFSCTSYGTSDTTDLSSALPPAVINALRTAQVPQRDTAFVVQPLTPGGLKLSLNAQTPMNPASTMKLVTTYAALQLLGPAYTWRTEVFASGPVKRDTLEGTLALRGSGDPKLVIEHLWLLVQRIRGYGIRHLNGDVLLDKSLFDVGSFDPAAFDAQQLRPYNTGPDALLLNFKAVTFTFVPDLESRNARVLVIPAVAGLNMPAPIKLAEGGCGDWRARLQGEFTDPLNPKFKGAFPAMCGEQSWSVSLLTPQAYFEAVFRALWSAAGGTWTGQLREGAVPADARRIAVHESEALAQMIRDINKFSNNVMARQLLLTLAVEIYGRPASTANGAEAVKSGLAARGLELPELNIENGAGLSRTERVSAQGLANLLQHAYASVWMAEFMSSLPVVGVDGTMKKRSAAASSAHIKTGLLADVRAIAGYVQAASGKRYVVVALINHAQAGAAQNAHDALLEWVYRNG